MYEADDPIEGFSQQYPNSQQHQLTSNTTAQPQIQLSRVLTLQLVPNLQTHPRVQTNENEPNLQTLRRTAQARSVVPSERECYVWPEPSQTRFPRREQLRTEGYKSADSYWPTVRPFRLTPRKRRILAPIENHSVRNDPSTTFVYRKRTKLQGHVDAASVPPLPPAADSPPPLPPPPAADSPPPLPPPPAADSPPPLPPPPPFLTTASGSSPPVSAEDTGKLRIDDPLHQLDSEGLAKPYQEGRCKRIVFLRWTVGREGRKRKRIELAKAWRDNQTPSFRDVMTYLASSVVAETYAKHKQEFETAYDMIQEEGDTTTIEEFVSKLRTKGIGLTIEHQETGEGRKRKKQNAVLLDVVCKLLHLA